MSDNTTDALRALRTGGLDGGADVAAAIAALERDLAEAGHDFKVSEADYQGALRKLREVEAYAERIAETLRLEMLWHEERWATLMEEAGIAHAEGDKAEERRLMVRSNVHAKRINLLRDALAKTAPVTGVDYGSKDGDCTATVRGHRDEDGALHIDSIEHSRNPIFRAPPGEWFAHAHEQYERMLAGGSVPLADIPVVAATPSVSGDAERQQDACAALGLPTGYVAVPLSPTAALLRPFFECPIEELFTAWDAMVRIAQTTVPQSRNAASASEAGRG